MRVKQHTFCISIENIDLHIIADVYGYYMSATRFGEEEHPEFEVKEIQLVDSLVNIYDLFTRIQLEIIDEEIKLKLQEDDE